MTVQKAWIGAALLASFATAANAADAAAPKPDPAMRQLDFFVGVWLCDGRDSASSLGPEHPVQARIEFVPDLDGVWLAVHWQEQPTSANTSPWKLENAFTYDPTAREFVFLARDNTGIASSGTSAGWHGDAFVVSGSFGGDGKQIRFRDTYTRTGDGAFDFATEVDYGGQWTTDATLDCKKAP
jgi:hypothetical protein